AREQGSDLHSGVPRAQAVAARRSHRRSSRLLRPLTASHSHRRAQVSSKDQLLTKIENRTACIGVVGLGYVGLPLALEFARAGFKVIGYDVSERVVKGLMSGKSHIQDVPSEELSKLVKAGKFEATKDEKRMQEMDAISIAVPTPLAKTRDPDMGFVIAAADAIGRNCRPGIVVVLE